MNFVFDTSILSREVEDSKFEIFYFYRTLTFKLLKAFHVEYLTVAASIRDLSTNYKQVSDGILPVDVDYSKKSNCIAYLYRHAACHAALVFDAVSEILDSSSSEVLSSKLNKKSLNVMFLGSGPGNDLVGFLTALYNYHHDLFDLDVTVVDNMPGWEEVFNETIESLKQGNGGNAGSIFEEVNITTTFISADLIDSQEWDEIMESKLENADIIFFVKVLSHIPDYVKLQALQNVVACMKPESQIIYIDYPYPYYVFMPLSNHLRTVYQGWEMMYFLGNEDYEFGCRNISSCRAVVKVFERCDNYYSGYY